MRETAPISCDLLARSFHSKARFRECSGSILSGESQSRVESQLGENKRTATGLANIGNNTVSRLQG